jgi:short-subunit dehydrogenase
MVSFSQALQAEVAEDNIRVQCLCPGLTRTEIHDTHHFEGFDKSRLPSELWMDAGPVVAASLAALAQNQVVVIPGAVNLEMVRGALQRQLGSLQ